LLGIAVTRASPAPGKQAVKALLGIRRPANGWLRDTLWLFLPMLALSRVVAIPLAWLFSGAEPEIPQGSLLILAILVPFFEEMLFRGLLLELWRPRGKLAALVFTSVLFGMGHGVWLMPSTLLMGWFLAWLVWEYDSIWPAFLIHAGNNLFSTLLGRYLGAGPEPAVAAVTISAITLCAGLVISVRIRPRLRAIAIEPWREYPPGKRLAAAGRELAGAVRHWPVAVVVILSLIGWGVSVAGVLRGG
jgi:membrane protease YdiL (CAAX protease family)